MRKVLLGTALLAMTMVNVGCIIPIFSSQPDIRARQLIFTSENFRQITEIWERIWFLDQPDFETPYRTHGGVI
ncbi:MAG: hypothetical protein KDA68_17150 [Planctomycetaceae bacterium]|nr:hypothetical protein [Planctomycetaceae bacterium]